MTQEDLERLDREYTAAVRFAFGVFIVGSSVLLWLFYEMWR